MVIKFLLFPHSKCIIKYPPIWYGPKLSNRTLVFPFTPVIIITHITTIIMISPFVKSHSFHFIFFFDIFLLTQQDGHGLQPFTKTFVDLFLLLMCFQYLFGCIVWRTISFSSLSSLWFESFLGWPYFHLYSAI